jgi:PAS domain S-box-containing protein
MASTESETKAEVNLDVEAWNWTPVADFAPIGIFRTTPKGRFSYVNMQLARIFEFESADDMKEKVKDIAKGLLVVPPELESQGVVSEFKYASKTTKGTYRKLSLTARRLGDGDDRFLVGFLRDVTEHDDTQSRLV